MSTLPWETLSKENLGGRLKLLYLIPHSLVPANQGNKTLTLNLLRHVTGHAKCDLAILGINPSPATADAVRAELPQAREIVQFKVALGLTRVEAKICAGLQLLHPAHGNYYSAELRRWLELSAANYDVLHFDMMHMVQYRSAAPRQRAVLVASDAYSLAARRARLLSHRRTSRLALRVHEWFFRRVEVCRYPSFDAICTVSSSDTEHLRAAAPSLCVETVGIPLGPEYAERVLEHFQAGSEHAVGIICTGALNHEIVARGIARFVQAVAAALKTRRLPVAITVLGRDPVPKLVRVMAEAGARHVEFVKDYVDFLDQDWVYVYAQECGSGLQTKLQQAMALGLPVIGLPISFEGLRARNGEHARICDTAVEMAEAAVELYSDRKRRRALGVGAASYVRQTFSIDAVGSRFMRIYEDVVRRASE